MSILSVFSEDYFSHQYFFKANNFLMFFYVQLMSYKESSQLIEIEISD